MKSALLIVDVQIDFCPGGALAVPEGDRIIAILNKYIKVFSEKKLPIFASRDWHPPETTHFKKFGGQWPQHCIQDTPGAAFHPVLRLPEDAVILSKGVEPDKDGYSAFQAIDNKGEEFAGLLKKNSVKELFIGGLATDYCVRWTVVDALKYGLRITVLEDAIKGVNLKPHDSEDALKEMFVMGAGKITFEKLSRMLSEEKK